MEREREREEKGNREKVENERCFMHVAVLLVLCDIVL